MAKKFSTLTAKKSPEWRERVDKRARKLLSEMPLQELRRARHVTQEALAEALETSQPEVSKIERRVDMYVSTLRRFIEAMGGELEVIARFPDGSVKIKQFGELDEVHSK
jgi:transcriptional regulator with XRE-family HTH domain